MSDHLFLLPPNATETEKTLDRLSQERLGIPMDIERLWNVETCPAAFLPWLAWAFSVDVWEDTWTDETKRMTIASSIEVHRRKGTVGSIKRALQAAGLGNATLVEGATAIRRDGTYTYDGSQMRGTAAHWATYRVFLTRPISIAQGQQVISILDAVAPARCEMAGLIFDQAAHLYNRSIVRDGTQTRGTVV